MIAPRLKSVLVKPLPKEQIVNGIHIPVPFQKFATGIVQSVGKDVEAPLKEGDKIMYTDRHAVKDGDCELVEEDLIECVIN